MKLGTSLYWTSERLDFLIKMFIIIIGIQRTDNMIVAHGIWYFVY